MKDLYSELSMPRIINAAGKMTYLGSSSVNEHAVETMVAASQCSFDMELLKERMSEAIAAFTNSDGGCVTSCAAAGIVTSVAAVLSKDNLYQVEQLPNVLHDKREVVLQKGHAVHFGAQMLQMIRLPGAVSVEIGSVSKCESYHLEGALTDRTAAVLYVVSHHAVQNGMMPLEQVAEIAHRHGVPVIVDAAAEVDVHKYLQAGGDLVVYSGHKAFNAPTSGFICGRNPYIHYCKLQDKGIGRAMKVGKENILGLYQSLIDYNGEAYRQIQQLSQKVDQLKRELDGVVKNIMLSVQMDATRPIPRLKLQVLSDAPFTARQLIQALESGDPSIRTRNHAADSGSIQFDPREIRWDDIPLISEKIRTFLR
ncbi:aminotransferase class V-fold PLP-dependent enzyme [Alicyclobacillus curvatus]|jgi:uncharacterized pyridoxal phosphate-dependent enzyme|nr:aminotransferase class V-fold PLP-dependent enzyme [Alicyclobacillus curvatus]